MVVEATFITASIALVVGVLAGAFWAWLGWLKSGEEFNNKKFTLGIVTGAVGSLAIVLLNVIGIINATDATQQLLALVALFLAVGGIDTARTGISGAIAQRAVEA